MQAVRQQLEAKRKEVEKLLEKLNKESEELNKESDKEGGPSTSTSPHPKIERRQVIVRDEAVKPVIRTRVEQRPAVAKAHAEAASRRVAVPIGQRTEVSTTEPAWGMPVATLDSSADPMRLAELVSNAIGALEQARAAVDDVHGDSSHRHVAESRVRSAERKVRLLSRIAQSLHSQAAAQAKRTNSQHDQDEIDSKLRILELIQSDVESALGKAATSVTPAVPSLPAVPAGTPVVQTIPAQILVELQSATAPVAPAGPVAPVAALPAPAAASKPAAVPAPAGVAAPAAAPAPVAPTKPAVEK